MPSFQTHPSQGCPLQDTRAKTAVTLFDKLPHQGVPVAICQKVAVTKD